MTNFQDGFIPPNDQLIEDPLTVKFKDCKSLEAEEITASLLAKIDNLTMANDQSLHTALAISNMRIGERDHYLGQAITLLTLAKMFIPKESPFLLEQIGTLCLEIEKIYHD